MDLGTAIVLMGLLFFLGIIIGLLISLFAERYWKCKYEEIAKDVDKKVGEVIHSMSVEMFKIEKELVERQYKDKGE